MASATTIYTLRHPETKEIRYIGKTNDPAARLSRHIHNATHGVRTHISTWIRSLPSKPIMSPLCVVPNDYGSEMERRTIAHFRSKGYRLTNLTDGGEGTLGWIPSAEFRAKLSAAHRGRQFSEQHKAALSAALMGHTSSPERNAKNSASQRGRKCSPETRAKLSAAGTRRRHSPESRARIGASNRGKTLGRKHSPETKAKISASLFACYRKG